MRTKFFDEIATDKFATGRDMIGQRDTAKPCGSYFVYSTMMSPFLKIIEYAFPILKWFVGMGRCLRSILDLMVYTFKFRRER